jgi:hypothetical protein
VSQRSIHKGNDNVFVTNVHIATNGFMEDYSDHKSSPILPSLVEMSALNLAQPQRLGWPMKNGKGIIWGLQR